MAVVPAPREGTTAQFIFAWRDRGAGRIAPCSPGIYMIDPNIPLLRHTVASVAYRGGKTLRGAPPEFADFRVSATSRTPAEILAHIGDLFQWALCLANGRHEWHAATPLPWNQEIDRFFAALDAFDKRLATGGPTGFPAEKLFQGPIADALTHLGQIGMLRRIAGHPVRGENYFKADIAAGRVGRDQLHPRLEFD